MVGLLFKGNCVENRFMIEKERAAERFNGVRSRLIIIVLLCLLPVALIMAHSTLENRRITSEQAVERLSTVVELIENEVEDAIAASVKVLTSLSLSPASWLTASQDCHRQLARLTHQYAEYSNIFSISTEGKVICSGNPMEGQIDLTDRLYIQQALAGQSPAIGQATRGRVTEEMIIPIAVPMYDADGRLQGAIGVSIQLSQLLQKTAFNVRRSNTLNQTTATLWRADGTVLARSPDTLDLSGEDARESELFQTLIRAVGVDSNVKVVGLDQLPRQYAFARIGKGEAALLLTAGLPTADLFAEVDEIYYQTIFILIFVSLLVLVLAWIFGESAVRRPIRRIADLAAMVAQGKHDVRAGPMTGASELKQLARNFDQMVIHLANYEQEQNAAQLALNQAKDQLELKVQERTLALESAHLAATEKAETLELQRRENIILNELTDMLQSVQTLEESWPVISRSLERLFAECSGAIYMYRESGNALERSVSWGNPEVDLFESFAPEDCWSLRLGRQWFHDEAERQPVCQHITAENHGNYLCLPMSADGKTLGVLHMRLNNTEIDQVQEHAHSVTARLALALSNVKLRQSLRTLSMRDALTGLYNRRFVEEVFEHEVSRCERGVKPLAIMMIDIDHFKRFNDTFGHEAGDSVLRAIGSVLKTHFRKTDLPCRLGGEEFLVILPECDQQASMTLAEALRQKVEQLEPHHQGKSLGNITISIGVANWPKPEADQTVLIAAADAALYQVKHSGRNQVMNSGDKKQTSA